MKLILLFGPPAVGKMTIGQELEKITHLKLLHNHMTIDLLHPFFGFGEDTWRISTIIREEIFKAAVKTELEGVVFTFVWSFESKKDWEFVSHVRAIFEEGGGDVYFVELEADPSERLIRNQTPHRLEHKATKRNVEESEAHLIETQKKHRLNSLPNEIREANYIRIDNTELEPEAVAKMIKDRFGF
ncbi:AAA family ATPase [Planococcus sp. SSTMD024]|uniref:AAA family ATPase n=1 Tax=Planococcus sp. SSTMD024 TaxID=3242163 RepID=UPI00351E31D8